MGYIETSVHRDLEVSLVSEGKLWGTKGCCGDASWRLPNFGGFAVKYLVNSSKRKLIIRSFQICDRITPSLIAC